PSRPGILGGAGYLVDVLAQFLVPDLGERIATFVVIPPAVAEIATLGYLLVIGVKTPKPDGRTPAAASSLAKTERGREPFPAPRPSRLFRCMAVMVDSEATVRKGRGVAIRRCHGAI